MTGLLWIVSLAWLAYSSVRAVRRKRDQTFVSRQWLKTLERKGDRILVEGPRWNWGYLINEMRKKERG